MDLPVVLTESLIKRGAIFHSNSFADIDHGKLFVVIGYDNDKLTGFFFINSEINLFIQKRKALFELQLPLLYKKYSSFLKYDSYLDCHELKIISKVKLNKQLLKNETQYKGQLLEDDLDLILDAVIKSDLFSDYEKQTYFCK